MEQLGAIRSVRDDVVTVSGPAEGLHASDAALDCGNSGTTMRLLAGLVSAVAGEHELVGDASLSQRPMDRIAEPLALMGASVLGRGPRLCAPLHVVGTKDLRGIRYDVPMASAQVKSAILFAALGASAPTTVVEHVRTRPTTEEMFSRAGVALESVESGQGRSVTIWPGRPLARNWLVPGDPSQAAFFAVLGCVHPDADLEVLDIDSARERVGFLGVLQRMGATMTLQSRGATTSLTVRSSALSATEVHASEIPSVDEVPVLVVAAAAAEGVSCFRDVGELRVKESDRFEGSLALATKLGCRAWSEDDDLFVEGLGSASRFAAFEVDAGLDHRMVMASAVAGCAGQGCSIGAAETVASSYPYFFDDLRAPRVSGLVIAIDGPAGSGKSTVARAVAALLGWSFLDTGAMYRAVTWEALHRGVDVRDDDALAAVAEDVVLTTLPRVTVNGRDVEDEIRTDEINVAVSVVAANPRVRSSMVARQRELAAAQPLGTVVEGRDITTVVFPERLGEDLSHRVARRARPSTRGRGRGLGRPT